MQRIAVVAGPDAGHALPALGLAAALRRRGHDVRFVSGPAYLAAATSAGLASDLLPLLAPTAQDIDLGHRLWRRAAEMAPPLAHQLAAWRPHLFVVDTLTRAGAFAAQLLDRPWVELIPHHLDDPDPDLPPIGLGRPVARTPWRRMDDRRLLRLQARSLALGAEQAAEAARQAGVGTPAHPALRLVGTLPSLEKRRHHWPGDAHVVGPLACDLDAAELELPTGDGPIVLVTESTATGVDTPLGEVAMTALRGAGVRLAITSPRIRPQRSLGVTVGQGPHRPLLAHAAVAVSPGGAGFLTKAAAAGVPQLVIPMQGDQREGAARLVDSGAGVRLSPRRLSAGRLRRAVLALLDDAAAREAAGRLAAEAAALGPETAADLVEALLAGESPGATSPWAHLPGAGPGPQAAAPGGTPAGAEPGGASANADRSPSDAADPPNR